MEGAGWDGGSDAPRANIQRLVQCLRFQERLSVIGRFVNTKLRMPCLRVVRIVLSLARQLLLGVILLRHISLAYPDPFAIHPSDVVLRYQTALNKPIR